MSRKVMMAYRINVEILLSNVEVSLIHEHKINIPRICVEAVQEELANRNALKANLGGISTQYLQIQLAEAHSQLEQLRRQCSAQTVPVHLKRR